MFDTSSIQQSKYIKIIHVPERIPETVSRLRNLLVTAREKDPDGLRFLLKSEWHLPTLSEWETMSLLEFGIEYPYSIRHYLSMLEEFLREK